MWSTFHSWDRTSSKHISFSFMYCSIKSAWNPIQIWYSMSFYYTKKGIKNFPTMLFIPSSKYKISKMFGLHALPYRLLRTLYRPNYTRWPQKCVVGLRRTATCTTKWMRKMKMWNFCMVENIDELTWEWETSTSWLLLAWVSYIHQISDTLTWEVPSGSANAMRLAENRRKMRDDKRACTHSRREIAPEKTETKNMNR